MFSNLCNQNLKGSSCIALDKRNKDSIFSYNLSFLQMSSQLKQSNMQKKNPDCFRFKPNDLS